MPTYVSVLHAYMHVRNPVGNDTTFIPKLIFPDEYLALEVMWHTSLDVVHTDMAEGVMQGSGHGD